jgi:hypothetical protein
MTKLLGFIDRPLSAMLRLRLDFFLIQRPWLSDRWRHNGDGNRNPFTKAGAIGGQKTGDRAALLILLHFSMLCER